MTNQDKNIKNKDNAQSLRHKAETLVNIRSDALNVGNLTVEAIQALLHELEVHQIELEMQNEELRESHIVLDIARSRYFDLYDLAPVGYLTLNSKGMIQKANLTAATLLGITRSVLIKQPISNLILNADEDIYYLNKNKLMENGDPQSFDLRLVKTDSTVFWANVTITIGTDTESAIFDEKNQDAFELRAVISDISERKHAELALEEAKKMAEQANLAKSTFLSSMSHELRTPLNAILGFAQLIEVSNPALSLNQKRNTEQIIKAGWYLLTLINEILDLAVIESGKTLLITEIFLLSDVLTDSHAMLENQAQKRGITLIYAPGDLNFLVTADRTRLKQVFVNLISNAIKYNKPNGTVTIRCALHPNQRLRIFIEDTGDGLTPKDLAQLFQPFNRLGRESGNEEGTGIGLVVCKRIVELMNGAIGVNSEVGRGSIFWVELDLAVELSLAV